MAYVFGLDIGYSGSKTRGGDHLSKEVEDRIMPSGVLPRSEFGLKAGSSGGDQSIVDIIVDGEDYVAGIPAQEMRMADRPRSLDENYTDTLQYRALFHAALAASGRHVIDYLVTGLPVRQALDGERRKNLAAWMQGEHRVNRERVVHVRHVEVIPQPYGTYSAALSTYPEHEDGLCEGIVLVGDPGYFSLDWIVISQGGLTKRVSSDSQLATSKLIEAMAEHIAQERGAQVRPEKIESALQRGRDYVLVGGKRVLISELAEICAPPLIERSMADVLQSLRGLGEEPDYVILGGGGAKFWEPGFRDAYKHSTHLVLPDPVMSNAAGFHQWAVGLSME